MFLGLVGVGDDVGGLAARRPPREGIVVEIT